MALFSSTTGNGRTETVRSRRHEAGGLSIVAADLRVTGDLEADGVVKIEGQVTGTVRAGAQVLVAPGAVVEGNIETVEAVVGGEVRGDIIATDRVELQPTCVVHGSIRTRRLLIQEGGQVNGAVTMEQGAGGEA